jgi:muconate cycloisomerase
MEISSVEAIPVSVPYTNSLDIAGGGSTTADYLVVRVLTDEGIEGVGEASTTPSFAGAGRETVAAAIDAHLGPAVVGVDPRNLAAVHDAMDRVLSGSPFAKAAVDIACHDVAGKALDVPVSTLLGGLRRDAITVGQSVGIKNVDKAVADAERAVERDGFASVKVKVGTDPDRDRERVRAVVDAIGDRVPVRVDANQGYTADVAMAVFSDLEATCDLLFVEQPVPKSDLSGLARVARGLTTPVVADESVFGPADASEVIRREAGDVLNVKIMKAGGLAPARKIAAVAAAAATPVLVGSMVELGVGTAAGAHFAATLPANRYPSDVKGPTLLEDDLLETSITIENGKTAVPEGPGLGVGLDESALDRYRVD